MTALEEIKKALEELREDMGVAYDKGDSRISNILVWCDALNAISPTLESLQRENEALKKDRDFWKEQFQVETRYRIELADRGTLLALTDANSRAEAAETEVKRLTQERYDLAYAITGGEDAPGLLDTVPTPQLVEIARNTHRSHSADIDRAEAAEAEVKRYRVALIAAKTRMRNCRGAIESDQVVDKDVHGSLGNGIRDIQDALASTGGEHHAE
jgi:hypothetical protein